MASTKRDREAEEVEATPLVRMDSSLRRRPPPLLSSSAENTRIGNDEMAQAFIAAHDNFIIAMDGVLWDRDVEIPGAFAALQALRQQGKRLVFVTNQDSVSRSELVKKFARFDFQVDSDDIVTSASAAAHYLVTFHPSVRKAYVIGEAGVIAELEQVGIACCGGGEDGDKTLNEDMFASAQADAAVGAVVCGWDRGFNFFKLSMASLYLQRGCALVATHRKASENSRDGRHIPGNGALVAAVEAASGTEAVVTGKPSQLLGGMIIEKYGMEKSRTCVIGDCVDTDVLLGKSTGLHTALVTSGETHDEDIADVCSNTDTCPEYILESIAKLLHK